MKRQMRHFLSVFVVACTLSFVAGPAFAEVVTFNYSGTVTFVTGSPFGLSPAAGDEVTGSIVYNTSLPPAFDTGTLAGYIQEPPSGMTVVIEGATVRSEGDASLQVQNDAYGSDGFNGFFPSISVDGMPQAGTISFFLSDSTATVFSSTALPDSLDVASFTGRSGSVFAGSSTVFFSIDTLEKAAIPVEIVIKPRRIELDDDLFEEEDGCDDDDKIRVVILSTQDFDALTVDPDTAELGDSELFGTATPIRSRKKDKNRDGDKDLVLTFATCDLVENYALNKDTTELELMAQTFAGSRVIGSDNVKVEVDD